MRFDLIAVMAALFTLCLGCTTPPGEDPRGDPQGLEDTQRRYTQLVRWGEIEKASTFVDPEARDDFLGYVADFEAIRITDFENGPFDMDGEPGTATVEVTYHAYSLRTMIEQKIRADQVWYVEGEEDEIWRVRPELDGIVDALHGRIPEVSGGGTR